MRVAIDFGTTYTKLSYLDEQSQLQLFRYPAAVGDEYVPTAVAYRRSGALGGISIGQAARTQVLNEPNVVFCENFKMLLPLERREQWVEQGWAADADPAAVALDYFQQLLREDSHAFEQQVGRISGLVVSVPEVWQQTPDNRGAEAVRRIFRDELALPLQHLQSEPVCAAAYYAYRYQRAERREQRAPFIGNLLMCDVGGGTFDVALCRVEGNRITVIDFDGNGERELGLAGVSFDRQAVRLAWQEHHQSEPDLTSVDFIDALRAFERVKIERRDDLEQLLQYQRSGQDEFANDAPLYRFKRQYKLTYDQVVAAFEPVRLGITQVLGRLSARAASQGHNIDRIAIVGGFGQFPLVREAILAALGVTDSELDVRYDPTMHGQGEAQQRAFAIAYGAALIANEQIETVEYYPHEIGIHGRDGLSGNEITVPVIRAGDMPAGRGHIVFAKRDEKRQVFSIRNEHTSGSLPVRIRVRGEGRWKVLRTSVEQFPPRGDYHVGVKLDRSNLISLVFQPTEQGCAERVYDLGQLSFES